MTEILETEKNEIINIYKHPSKGFTSAKNICEKLDI